MWIIASYSIFINIKYLDIYSGEVISFHIELESLHRHLETWILSREFWHQMRIGLSSSSNRCDFGLPF